ncbi:MAG TPA: hypothetical protein VGS04_05020 [Nitrososphaerales archaeon]|nr:hypothetical protein [Nitrososphaerales archaeon]
MATVGAVPTLWGAVDGVTKSVVAKMPAPITTAAITIAAPSRT